jgi:hypothetical protein
MEQIGAIVAIATILIVFIAPAFAVQPTALRASRAAQQTLMAFALLTTAVITWLLIATFPLELATFRDDRNRILQLHIIDLTCARLC